MTSDLAVSEAPRIARLALRNFRSYATLELSTDASLVALVGENGAGKTNLLEALSLFTPGRGLRRADLADMVRHGASRATVAVGLADGRRLGVALGQDETGARTARTSRIDGAPASSTAAFAEHLRIVWLTPDLDGLFRGSPGERRRFLDRLVLAVDPRHAARVSSLDRALRSRNRLLQDATPSPAWLDAVERELAELAVVVGSARRETVERLDAEMLAARDEASPFPHARLALEGAFDALVAALPAVDVEDRFLGELRVNRRRDAVAGRTLAGPQMSDLTVRHGPKNLPAATCSTGEQKALLLGLAIAHARLVRTMSGIAPLVLLDEIAAHLDPIRREALYGVLDALGGQVWMTGADPLLFEPIRDRADLLVIRSSSVRRDP